MADRRQSTAIDAAKIAAEFHERNSGSHVRVLRMVVDGHSEVPSYLGTLAHHLGGAMIDSGTLEPTAPINGEPPPSLATAITTALSVPDSWEPRTFKLVSSPAASVLFEELGPGIAGSDAEAKLLSLGAALLQPEVLTSEFVVVVYSESGMADPFRRAAWSLGRQLEGLQLGLLRTLVLVAEVDADPDVHIHCQHETGYTVGHVGGIITRRHEPERLGLMTSRFASASGPLVLYLGAGFSASSGLPLGNKLRDATMQAMLGAGASGVSGPELSRMFRAAHQGVLTAPEQEQSDAEFDRSLTFERVVGVHRLSLWPPQSLVDLQERNASIRANEPSAAVTSVHNIIRSGFRLIIFTVNLDQLIEHGVEEHVEVFATDEEFESAADYIRAYVAGSEERVPVLKLHGTITDLDSCVVTKEQTEAGLPAGKREALVAAVKSTDTPSTFVYIGASMRDLDVNRDLSRTEVANNSDEFWVNPTMIDSIKKYADSRTYLWNERGAADRDPQARLITETADVFLSSLWAQVSLTHPLPHPEAAS